MTSIEFKDFFLKYKDEHYAMYGENRLYKFKIGEVATMIAENLFSENFKKECACIEDGALYTAYHRLADTIELAKFENGNRTIFKTLKAQDFSCVSLLSIFNLGKTFYLLTLKQYSSPYQYNMFKSSDFGITWTDITSQISLFDNVVLANLNSTKKIIYKGVLYIFYKSDIHSFNGKECRKVKSDVNIINGQIYSEGCQCDYAPIYTTLVNSDATGEDTTRIFSVLKFEERNGEVILKKINKDFKSGSAFKKILSTGDTILYPYTNNNKNFVEYPVSAYIEDREKG